MKVMKVTGQITLWDVEFVFVVDDENILLIPKEKEDIKPQKRFAKPTLEAVQAYCLERGKGVDPQKWYDYYSANGWKVGKNPMKDWKAAVRTWERSGNNGGSRSVSFTPYPDEY